jgi:hypothetical protein
VFVCVRERASERGGENENERLPTESTSGGSGGVLACAMLYMATILSVYWVKGCLVVAISHITHASDQMSAGRLPQQRRVTNPTPYTRHPTPYTLQPTPYTHHEPYTLHSTADTLTPFLDNPQTHTQTHAHTCARLADH